MNHKKALARNAGLLLSAAVLLGAAGCSAGNDAGGSGGGDSGGGKDYTITLVPGMTAHPAYQTMLCGAREQAKKLGVTVKYQGANEWDPAKQVPVVQGVLAGGTDALLLVPSDSSALRAPVEQFLAADIPVITVDTGLKNTDGLTGIISSDNVQGGEAAADALGKAIGGKGTVAIISGLPSATTDVARVKGFKQEMEKKYPDVKVLDPQYSRSVVAKAESETKALILAHPDLKGVFGVNGNSATGAANAITTSGHKGEIMVAGYDAEPATVEQLKKGNINILVVQDFKKEGRLAVKDAYAALTGKKDDIKTPIVLNNIIATTENADDPDVSKYFYLGKCKE